MGHGLRQFCWSGAPLRTTSFPLTRDSAQRFICEFPHSWDVWEWGRKRETPKKDGLSQVSWAPWPVLCRWTQHSCGRGFMPIQPLWLTPNFFHSGSGKDFSCPIGDCGGFSTFFVVFYYCLNFVLRRKTLVTASYIHLWSRKYEPFPFCSSVKVITTLSTAWEQL